MLFKSFQTIRLLNKNNNTKICRYARAVKWGGLKILRLSAYAGSNPVTCTHFFKCTSSCGKGIPILALFKAL